MISFLCGQIDGDYKLAHILGSERRKIHGIKAKIGYAPQEIALYPMLSGRENLAYFARLLSAPKSAVDQVLEWMDLEDRAQDLVTHYSGGMKRRLNLGVALLNQPELLVLDEPTVGVDPQSRLFIFEKLLELKSQGVTLIYSTHYLEEVRRLCSDAGVLVDGRLIENGPVSTVLGNQDLEKRFLELTEGEAR